MEKIEVEVKIHHLQPWYTRAWLLWLLSFVVIEGVALISKKQGDTLSEHVWEWFDINVDLKDIEGQKKAASRAKKFVLLSFLGWLVAHFLTGGQF